METWLTLVVYGAGKKHTELKGKRELEIWRERAREHRLQTVHHLRTNPRNTKPNATTKNETRGHDGTRSQLRASLPTATTTANLEFTLRLTSRLSNPLSQTLTLNHDATPALSDIEYPPQQPIHRHRTIHSRWRTTRRGRSDGWSR